MYSTYCSFRRFHWLVTFQDANRAREEITSLFSTHVQGIKKIYEDTLFTNYAGTLSYGGITFIVHRVKVSFQYISSWRESIKISASVCHTRITNIWISFIKIKAAHIYVIYLFYCRLTRPIVIVQMLKTPQTINFVTQISMLAISLTWTRWETTAFFVWPTSLRTEIL